MSRQLMLRVAVSNHKRPRTKAIKAAVSGIIQQEKLEAIFSPMRRLLGDDLEVLHTYTLRPIDLNGTADAWLRDVRRNLRAAIRAANRGPCDVSIRAEYH